MRISLFILLFSCLISNDLSAQESVVLILTGKDGPVTGAWVFSRDKKRHKTSDSIGMVNWEINQYPDTLLISHLAYTNQQYIFLHRLSDAEPLKINLQSKTVLLGETQVEASWVKPNSAIVQSTLNRDEIESNFLVQDIPYIIQRFPSTVTTSDAGNGIGYTNVRIRGLDPTQINVMINGVPLNDAESQSVFWVDLPDLISSASDIQVQRGIGVSGAGQVAFGASLLIRTNRIAPDPYIQVESAIGSFGTLKNSLQINSGLIKNRWNVEGRISQVHTNGFIDRARSRLWSGSMALSYLTARRSFRFFIFDGHERTYQAWYGVPNQFVNDPLKRRYNPAGTEKTGDPYENQIDRYRQTHFQLLHQETFGQNWEFQNTLHFTPGGGYYEEYKAGQWSSDYSLPGDQEINLVRKRNLENDFFGSIHSIKYAFNKVEFTTGLAWNGYLGRHFGQVTRINDIDSGIRNNYYDYRASKWSAMSFGKIDYHLKRWSLLADVQYRWIQYTYIPELTSDPKRRSSTLNFFNPKMGFTYAVNPTFQIFGFTGLAHREPNRNDYVQADLSVPKPEQLWDNEFGIRWNKKRFQLEQNLYLMEYKNQLIPTGKLNDVGAYIRSNVDRSFRLGSETSLEWQAKNLNVQGNLNLSQNKTLTYNEYIDDWDHGIQEVKKYKKQPIAFSPGFIGNFNLEYKLMERLNSKAKSKLFLEVAQQFVGRQYLDGTGRAASILKPYRLTQVAIRYQFNLAVKTRLEFRFQVNNIFDSRYESNGWIYRFRSDGYNPVPDDPFAGTEGSGIYHLKGLYPQAGRHVMLACRFRFDNARTR